MGGSNSGRRDGKATTESMYALKVSDLQRSGRLTPDQSFVWRCTRRGRTAFAINVQTFEDGASLLYRTCTVNGVWLNIDDQVKLAWTNCNYGGKRAWWICPGLGCGRRVGVLYGGITYLCRHCHNLAYTSQRETSRKRAIKRANGLRKLLGWVPGIIYGIGEKPPRMHWRTFNRLLLDYFAQSNSAFASLAAEMSSLTESLEEMSRRRL